MESKRASVGSTSPLSRAFLIFSSASLADLDEHTDLQANIKDKAGKSQFVAFIVVICFLYQDKFSILVSDSVWVTFCDIK